MGCIHSSSWHFMPYRRRNTNDVTHFHPRTYCLHTMITIVEPVLAAAAEGWLKLSMPVEAKSEDRRDYSHLEGLGRTLAGLAPWLEASHADPEEDRLRIRYADLARRSIASATDPDSPDARIFQTGLSRS